MKMKINKACDLDSISVLPPHSRRSSGVLPGPLSSHQLRSQPSQQSFSQGLSSQHGIFSQMSQNSLDEVVTYEQRLGSQERENSAKRISCLAPVSYAREESQMPRSSASLAHKWSSNSVSDHRCRVSEELEHKIGIIETSVNRFGMILDSVQSDVLQVNKGTKELRLELEGMLEKLACHDSLVQQMNKGQESVKNCLTEGLKSVTDQLSKNSFQDNLQAALLPLSALPEKIEELVLKLKLELCDALADEMKGHIALLRDAVMSNGLKNLNQMHTETCAHPPMGTFHNSALQKVQHPTKISGAPQAKHKQPNFVQKIEMGSWNSVKGGKSTFADMSSITQHKQKMFSSVQQESDWRVNIESDEEIGGVFPSLLEEKGADYLIEEASMETRRILRKARRRKRKHCNTIVID